MRVLQLCPRLPWPADDGGRIAMLQVTRGLQTLGHEVSIVGLNPRSSWTDPAQAQRELGARVRGIDTDTRPTPWGALWAAARGQVYAMSRYHAVPALRRTVQHELSAVSYDRIWLEGSYLAPLIPLLRANSKAPILLRAHNVEAQVWQAHARTAPNRLAAAYLADQTRRVAAYEARWLPLADAVLPLSQADADDLAAIVPQDRLRLLAPYAPPATDERPEPSYALGYLGALNWGPNRAGVEWFLREVWPQIRPAAPEANFLVAGKAAPSGWAARVARAPGVVVQSPAPSAAAFYDQVAVVVQPVLAGAGVRMKLLEAMASGRAVVTTLEGLRGVEAEGTVPTAADADGLAAALLMLLRQGSLRAAAARAAQAYVARAHVEAAFVRQLGAALA